jgi:hypothetical protein
MTNRKYLYSKTSANRLPHVVLIALQSVQDVVGISAKSCCRDTPEPPSAK